MERLFLLLFQSSCDFYLSRGFSELPQVLVNGVILELEEDVRDDEGTDLETMREREGRREGGREGRQYHLFLFLLYRRFRMRLLLKFSVKHLKYSN